MQESTTNDIAHSSENGASTDLIMPCWDFEEEEEEEGEEKEEAPSWKTSGKETGNECSIFGGEMCWTSAIPEGTTPASPSWETRYCELLQWRHEYGDTCVPKAEGALGRWVARQRELKRTGKLTTTREHKLKEINFVWNTVTAMWEERFQRLHEWKKEQGHCVVPIAQGELGTWVSKQRQLKKRSKLSKDKVDALNSLGFTWSTAEADWEEKFKRLGEWKNTHGHVSVPFNEGELGWWVNTQRQCKRKGKLSASRERRLQHTGFLWNPSKSRCTRHTADSSAGTASSCSQTALGAAISDSHEEKEGHTSATCDSGVPNAVRYDELAHAEENGKVDDDGGWQMIVGQSECCHEMSEINDGGTAVQQLTTVESSVNNALWLDVEMDDANRSKSAFWECWGQLPQEDITDFLS